MQRGSGYLLGAAGLLLVACGQQPNVAVEYSEQSTDAPVRAEGSAPFDSAPSDDETYGFTMRFDGDPFVADDLIEFVYEGAFDPVTGRGHLSVPTVALVGQLGASTASIDESWRVEQVTEPGLTLTRGLVPELGFAGGVDRTAWYDHDYFYDDFDILGDIHLMPEMLDFLEALDPIRVDPEFDEQGTAVEFVLDEAAGSLDDLDSVVSFIDGLTASMRIEADRVGRITHVEISSEEYFDFRVDIAFHSFDADPQIPDVVDWQTEPPTPDYPEYDDYDDYDDYDELYDVYDVYDTPPEVTIDDDPFVQPTPELVVEHEEDPTGTVSSTIPHDEGPDVPAHVVDTFFLPIDGGFDEPFGAAGFVDFSGFAIVPTCGDATGTADRAVATFDGWLQRSVEHIGADVVVRQAAGIPPANADLGVFAQLEEVDCESPSGVTNFTSGSLEAPPNGVSLASYRAWERYGTPEYTIRFVVNSRIAVAVFATGDGSFDAARAGALIAEYAGRIQGFDDAVEACAMFVDHTSHCGGFEEL